MKKILLIAISLALMLLMSCILSFEPLLLSDNGRLSSANTSSENSLLSELERKMAADDKNARTIDRMEALNFDIEDLRDADTETLLDLCLNNSLNIVVACHDKPSVGLEFFVKHFTPAQVLLQRSDALYYVSQALEDSDNLKYSQIIFLEALREALL